MPPMKGSGAAPEGLGVFALPEVVAPYRVPVTALIPGLTVVLAWIFALLGWSAVGADPSDTFSDSAMRWMLFLPGGIMFLVSAVMHTVLARKTAAQIGWQTNGFQYEIGFVSLGLGLAGIVAANSGSDAWWPIAIAQGVFLVLAAVNHVIEMKRTRNFAPGNTFILVYDIGLPVSYLALWWSLA
jgi:hypothetical protein